MQAVAHEIYERCSARDARLAQLQQLESLRGPQTYTRKVAIDWFHQAFRHCPFPAWMKDKRHVALAVNPAYSELYETATKQGLSFVGSTDESWPAEAAADFHLYDDKALRDGYTVTHEHVRNPVTGIEESIIGAKWVITLSDGDELVIGIAGGIIPKPHSALRDGR